MWTKLKHKFAYAFSGLWQGLKADHSIQLQYLNAVLALLIGWLFHFTEAEMITVIILCGIVIMAEYLNSALEAALDDHQTAYSPAIKKAKDLAAAAVLVISIVSAIVGIIILCRHL
jgi:diacylglycerol kinase